MTPTAPTSLDALIVFAKVPRAGQVKTRLTTLLDPDEAAHLYEAFLRDALEQYAELGVAVRLYLAGDAADLPADSVPEGVSVHRQEGSGLGERMQHAFLATIAAGHERPVIIGTDHPTLPSAFIQHAFEVLMDRRSIVLGPSDDGGYYLLGMNEFYPQLFTGMTYSHASVFDETVERAAGTSGTLTILPPWYDVDTPEALRRLAGDLEADAAALVHTRAVMDALREHHPALRS